MFLINNSSTSTEDMHSDDKDTSNRMEQKRAHNLFDQYKNKRQETISPNDDLVQAATMWTLESSSFESCQRNYIFRPKPIRISDFAHKNSSIAWDFNSREEVAMHPKGLNAPLSLSFPFDGKKDTNARAKKVQINQNASKKNKIIATKFDLMGSDLSLATPCTIIRDGGIFHTMPKNVISLGQASSNDGNFVQSCQAYKNIYTFSTPIGQRFENLTNNVMPIGANSFGINETLNTFHSSDGETNGVFESSGCNHGKEVIDTSISSISVEPTSNDVKFPSSVFPSNAKYLLASGILEGVPVQYSSWFRILHMKITLQGIVNGTRFLRGCQDCKLSKAVGPYLFEMHAGGKTRHPNNHIFFENGKTINAVVKELQNTPRDKLLETIENVIGSLLHRENFQAWKGLYEAAIAEPIDWSNGELNSSQNTLPLRGLHA